MTTLLIALGSFVLYIVAYHTYGKWLGGKLFKLDPEAGVPSVELEDGNDFVPTDKSVIFGHHFTSIAGTGPIVGPALAVIWGWVPALLWVLFGSIFIEAVHDFGALIVSVRNQGQTVGDIAGRVLAPRARILFLSILFLALTIVLAIFGLVIAAVFRMFPAAIFPCLVQIPLAVGIGLFLHRRGASLLIPSLIALVVMYVTVYFGNAGPLGAFNEWLGGDPLNPASNGLDTISWVIVLLIYSYVASVLPVWTLLQPRDFINSLQLISALALILIGLVVAAFAGGAPVDGARPALEIAAPAFRMDVADAPFIFPFLFVTIACGAVSGFHCLVSSGTSSKQIKCETDARFVGYGSMLTEGFLAVLVILACVAGLGLGIPGAAEGITLTGTDAYAARYETSATAGGLSAKVGAFVAGSANFLTALGLPAAFAVALMGVFVASFAATTLDTACRLQRYVTQELATAIGKLGRAYAPPRAPFSLLTNKHAATIFAISLAGFVAAAPVGDAPWAWDNAGKGGLLLWPLFGATNQLLAGLAFLVILFWLWRRGLPVWFIAIPAGFMLFLPGLAMALNLFGEGGFIAKENWLLTGFGIATLCLQAWILVEAFLAWPKAKGILEPSLPPLQPEAAAGPEAEGGRSC